MEGRNGILKAITFGVLAGKLRHAAKTKDTETAAALERAAARYHRGCSEALKDFLAGHQLAAL